MQVGRFIHKSSNSNVDREGLLVRTQVTQPKMNDSSVPGNERFYTDVWRNPSPCSMFSLFSSH